MQTNEPHQPLQRREVSATPKQTCSSPPSEGRGGGLSEGRGGGPPFGYVYASPDRYTLLREFQKQHRQFPTEAERLVWEYYTHNKLPFKLRRQYIIGDFIVDFVCLQAHLIIEIDGGYHFEQEQIVDDKQREKILQEIGFSVIRFTNEEVFRDISSVFIKISEKINGNRTQARTDEYIISD